MHRFSKMLALLCVASLATAASAATSPAPSTPAPAPVAAAKSATVGGGVRNPWSLPYTLAIVTVPEPSTLAVLGLGVAAMAIRRRR